MIVHPPERDGETIVLRADDDIARAATVRVPDGLRTDDTSDPSAIAWWLPAMRRGVPLDVRGDVSPRLQRGLGTIAEIALSWDRALYPDAGLYRPVPIHASPATRSSDGRPGRTACFFTGGVDSFHTVVTRRAEIDALVFVHGFDLGTDPTHPLNRTVSEHLRDAAAMLGLPLIEIVSDLQDVSAAAGVSWQDYHGAALATIAALLAPEYDRWLIPATTTYAEMYPLGSHPLLDPLWSTERVEIVHDGAWATRTEKIRTIAAEPAACRHLRVCYANVDGEYNCGRCEKCVRTGVGVRIAGVEGHFGPLPSPTLRQVADVRIRGLGLAWEAHRRELQRSGANERLRRAIDIAFFRRRLRSLPVVGRWMR